MVFLISSFIHAQSQYNVGKFVIYTPSGWQKESGEKNNIILTSSGNECYLSFLVINKGDEEVKAGAIFTSLIKTFNFDTQSNTSEEFNLDNALHVTFKYGNADMKEDNSKYKFIWAQIDNDEENSILAFGFCDYAKFPLYKNQIYSILKNIKYK